MVAHELLAALGVRFPRFSSLVHGRPRVLVRDGVVDHAAMRQARITEADLAGYLRLNAHLDSPAAVREARLERNGAISVLMRDPPRG